jgi:hypothetical protein
MPKYLPFRLRVALPVLAGAALLFIPATAAATKPVDLRVVTTSGKSLAEFRQYTGTTQIHTDTDPGPCSGIGPGTGDRVELDGATAMGADKDAAANDSALRPLSVSDSSGFGLFVCGIGGHDAGSSNYWYLGYNHEAADVGGDQLHVKPGDDVLWYLTQGFESPTELVLSAPPRSRPGAFDVSVTEHSCSYDPDLQKTVCSADPAAGVSIGGGDAPAITGVDGTATVAASQPGTLSLRGTKEGDVPTNTVNVCVDQDLGSCPDAHGKRIFGSDRDDDIHGTPGWDVIHAEGGDDRIDLTNGGEDRVVCGGGHDVVLRDGQDQVASSCEQVSKR